MRQPANQAPDWRQLVWDSLRKADAPVSAGHIATAIKAHKKTVQDYLTCLMAGGYLRQDQGEVPAFALIRDTGHHAPRLRKDGTPVDQGQKTEQLWRGMCMLKEFSFRDLVQNASIPIAEEAAKTYCALLLSTGYLRVVRKAQPRSGRIASYRLIRNSGPKPPQVQRVKTVYDPNTGSVYMPENRL